jgi:hypothetical protein
MHETKFDTCTSQLLFSSHHSDNPIALLQPRAASFQSHMSQTSLLRRTRLHHASWNSQDFRNSTIRTLNFGSRSTSMMLKQLDTESDSREALQQQRV